MKLILSSVVSVLLLVGCSSIQQEAVTTSTANGVTNRMTRLKVKTLFDAKQVVNAVRASNGATQSLGATGIEQETTTKVVGDIVDRAVTAGIKAGKP